MQWIWMLSCHGDSRWRTSSAVMVSLLKIYPRPECLNLTWNCSRRNEWMCISCVGLFIHYLYSLYSSILNMCAQHTHSPKKTCDFCLPRTNNTINTPFVSIYKYIQTIITSYIICIPVLRETRVLIIKSSNLSIRIYWRLHFQKLGLYLSQVSESPLELEYAYTCGATVAHRPAFKNHLTYSCPSVV